MGRVPRATMLAVMINPGQPEVVKMDGLKFLTPRDFGDRRMGGIVGPGALTTSLNDRGLRF